MKITIYNSSTKIDERNLPLGTTVVLECTASPLPRQAQYNWTCPNGPCDNEYRNVYNNVIVLVVTNTTTTTSGDKYKCTLRYEDKTAKAIDVVNLQTLSEREHNVYLHHTNPSYHNICILHY